MVNKSFSPLGREVVSLRLSWHVRQSLLSICTAGAFAGLASYAACAVSDLDPAMTSATSTIPARNGKMCVSFGLLITFSRAKYFLKEKAKPVTWGNCPNFTSLIIFTLG